MPLRSFHLVSAPHWIVPCSIVTISSQLNICVRSLLGSCATAAIPPTASHAAEHTLSATMNICRLHVRIFKHMPCRGLGWAVRHQLTPLVGFVLQAPAAIGYLKQQQLSRSVALQLSTSNLICSSQASHLAAVLVLPLFVCRCGVPRHAAQQLKQRTTSLVTHAEPESSSPNSVTEQATSSKSSSSSGHVEPMLAGGFLSSPEQQSASYLFLTATSLAFGVAALAAPQLLLSLALGVDATSLDAAFTRIAGATMAISAAVEYSLQVGPCTH